MFGIREGENETVECAEQQPEQHPARESLPAKDLTEGEPAEERYQREQVGDCVDPDDEHQAEDETADEKPSSRNLRSHRRRGAAVTLPPPGP